MTKRMLRVVDRAISLQLGGTAPGALRQFCERAERVLPFGPLKEG